MTITLKTLKELCRAYDKYYGKYPENPFEGKSVYDWITKKLHNKIKTKN